MKLARLAPCAVIVIRVSLDARKTVQVPEDYPKPSCQPPFDVSD